MLRIVPPALAGTLTLFGLLACATHQPMANSSATRGDLALSVQAETAGDSVQFVLQITNAGMEPIPLTFPTGQKFDFVVRDGAREIWRWSEDRMFTQMVQTVTLAPGDTETYSATWSPPAGLTGDLQVFATLAAMERRIEQGANFRIP